jgi:hypothetical protein
MADSPDIPIIPMLVLELIELIPIPPEPPPFSASVIPNSFFSCSETVLKIESASLRRPFHAESASELKRPRRVLLAAT